MEYNLKQLDQLLVCLQCLLIYLELSFVLIFDMYHVLIWNIIFVLLQTGVTIF